MINYQVVSNILVRKDPEARVISVVVGSVKGTDLSAMADVLVAGLRGSTRHLELYLYSEARAVEWSGWIAHIIMNAKNELSIDTNNDPDLRRATYEAFR